MKKFFILFVIAIAGCSVPDVRDLPAVPTPEPRKIEKIKNSGKVVHVMVALCDNENQGIVPVPAHLGNGEDPAGNLYWGAAFGVKTHFSRSRNWELVDTIKSPSPDVLERLVFKHREKNVLIVADAYRGSRMRQTIDAFFDSVSGAARENLNIRGETVQIGGGADLIAFVGHDGLMDFKFGREIKPADTDVRDAIVLACASRNYFFKPMKQSGARPLLWTSGLMAPEAYVLHDALDGWIREESPEQIRERAAGAYAKYQRIGINAAKNLFITGF